MRSEIYGKVTSFLKGAILPYHVHGLHHGLTPEPGRVGEVPQWPKPARSLLFSRFPELRLKIERAGPLVSPSGVCLIFF